MSFSLFNAVREYDSPLLHIVRAEDRLQIGVFTLAPGSSFPAEIHKHVTQYIRVESGRGEIRIRDKAYKIETGDSFIVPSGTIHSIHATGTLRLSTIYAKDSNAETWVH